MPSLIAQLQTLLTFKVVGCTVHASQICICSTVNAAIVTSQDAYRFTDGVEPYRMQNHKTVSQRN